MTPLRECEHIWLKVKFAGICGSDVNKFKANSFLDTYKFGHEIVGTILEEDSNDLYVVNPFLCNASCKTCEESSLMLCSKVCRLGCGEENGGFSGKVYVPLNNLYSIPAQCTHPEVGVFADAAAVCFHTVHVMNLDDSFKRMLIIGDGTLGILLSLLLKDLYANVMVDIIVRNPKKVEIIKEISNRVNIVDETIYRLHKNSYDIVVEAVGGVQSETLKRAIEMTRNSGDIYILGAFNEKVKIESNVRKMFYKQLSIHGINSFCKREDDFKNAVRWVFKCEQELNELLTNRYAVKDIDKGKMAELICEKKLVKGLFCYE